MVSKALIHNIVLTLGVVLGYPHGIISRKLQNPSYRKLFHLFSGLILCYLLYGLEFLYVALAELIVYLTLFLPNPINLSGILIPVCGVFYIHYKRLGTIGEWDSDLSGLIMFSALRLVMIIFNVFDGRRNLKRQAWINMELKSPPNIFDYYVYLFSFTGLYSGPVLPFSVFHEMMELKSSQEEDDEDIKKGLKPFGLSFLNGFFHGLAVAFFPTKMILDEAFYDKPYIVVLAISFVFSLLHSSRYVFAWLGCESGLLAQGAHRIKSFDPENCRSFRPEYFYKSRNLSLYVTEWNHSVHFFLKEFVYVRVISLNLPSIIAKASTFFVSAYWHGFYSGYYFYAFVVLVNSIVDYQRFKLFSPIIEKFFGESVAVTFDRAFSIFMNYYQGTGWDLLFASRYLMFFRKTYFGPFLFELLLILIGLIFRPRFKQSREKKD